MLAICLPVVSSAAVSCTTADARPCPPEATQTQLCVVTDTGATAINRPATTNLTNPSQNIQPDTENPQSGLAQVGLDHDRPLTIAIGPTEGLVLVEVDVYASKRDLADDMPTIAVECGPHGCNRWQQHQTRNGHAVRIPPADLQSGYVIVVRAFVHRKTEVRTVSWGPVIKE